MLGNLHAEFAEITRKVDDYKNIERDVVFASGENAEVPQIRASASRNQKINTPKIRKFGKVQFKTKRFSIVGSFNICKVLGLEVLREKLAGEKELENEHLNSRFWRKQPEKITN